MWGPRTSKRTNPGIKSRDGVERDGGQTKAQAYKSLKLYRWWISECLGCLGWLLYTFGFVFVGMNRGLCGSDDRLLRAGPWLAGWQTIGAGGWELSHRGWSPTGDAGCPCSPYKRQSVFCLWQALVIVTCQVHTRTHSFSWESWGSSTNPIRHLCLDVLMWLRGYSQMLCFCDFTFWPVLLNADVMELEI